MLKNNVLIIRFTLAGAFIKMIRKLIFKALELKLSVCCCFETKSYNFPLGPNFINS